MASGAPSEASWVQARDSATVNSDAVESLTKQYGELVGNMRKVYQTGRTKDLAWRKQQLRQISAMVTENYERITEAVMKDLGGSAMRGVAEMSGNSDAKIALANLDSWAAEDWVGGWFDRQYVRPEPKGLVLIIAPWNFPFIMCLQPLVPAIAAGNVVVLKPSELNGHSTPLIAELVQKYLDPECVRVIQGAVPETTALLNQRWDHIMYTGNGAIGRVVMSAAAKHLTPVTLELGGKSPVIIDETACISSAVQRVFLAKFMNAGQACIAPDFVLVHESQKDKFIAGMKEQLLKSYGENPQQEPEFGRIIAERHVDRLKRLIDTAGGQIIVGGSDKVDRADRYVPPTIILSPNLSSPIMQEEIFGPLLPVHTFSDLQDAIRMAQTSETPLAAYFFSQSRANVNTLLRELPSGGACINSCLEHLLHEGLPFGGQGASGIGAYHGKFGFDEFSHRRAVLQKSTLPGLRGPAFPPPTAGKPLPAFVVRIMLKFVILGQLPHWLGATLHRTTSFIGDSARGVLKTVLCRL